MEIDQEIFNTMLAKSMHQIARIEFRNSKFPYARGLCPLPTPARGPAPWNPRYCSTIWAPPFPAAGSAPDKQRFSDIVFVPQTSQNIVKIRKQTSIYNFYTYLSSTNTNILENELKKVNIFADFLSNFDIAFRTSTFSHFSVFEG